MKKTLLSFLIMMSLLLVGCTAAEKSKYGTDVGELPPALIMAGQNFFANTMSIDELPEVFSAAVLLAASSAFAQGNGMAGITEATNMVTSYFDPATKLIYAIGAVVGLIGGVKVYGKFSSGEAAGSRRRPVSSGMRGVRGVVSAPRGRCSGL